MGFEFRFRFRRDRLMNDAFDKILAVNAAQLRKCQMTVRGNISEDKGDPITSVKVNFDSEDG